MTGELDVKKRVKPVDNKPGVPSKHIGKIPLNVYEHKDGSHFPQKEKEVIMFTLQMWGTGMYTIQGRDSNGRITTVWRGVIGTKQSRKLNREIVFARVKKNLLEREGIQKQSKSGKRLLIKNPEKHLSKKIVKKEKRMQDKS